MIFVSDVKQQYITDEGKQIQFNYNTLNDIDYFGSKEINEILIIILINEL